MKGPFLRTYLPDRLNEKEILRYAGSKEKSLPQEATQCLKALPDGTAGRVVFALYPIRETQSGLDLGFTETNSEDLRKNLRGCSHIALFAATAGIGFDRQVRKFERLSPARALWYQAIGAAYAEAVCDAFCAELKAEYPEIRPRFSPGYGDLPLSMQREIFTALQPEKHIGVTLGENLFMTPSKSVTAIAGIVHD